MADEQTIAPQGEAQAEPVQTPADNSAPESGTEQSQPTDSQSAPQQQATEQGDPKGDKPKQTPWFQRRIDQLTAEKWEERRQKEALQAALESALGRGQPQPAATDGQQTQTTGTEQPAAPKPLSQADIDRLAEQKAKEIARVQAFNEACNKTYEAGKAEFGDFDDALKTYQMLGGLNPTFIDAAMATDAGHKVLYHLGKDPDEAARILSLTPTRMAIELDRIAQRVSKPTKPISGAPAPIRPVDGSARGEPDPDNMDTDAWMVWRNKNARKR